MSFRVIENGGWKDGALYQKSENASNGTFSESAFPNFSVLRMGTVTLALHIASIKVSDTWTNVVGQS